MTDEQLSALLRIKRHEQPPADYFDHLLRDIHRRQRADLLRRPLWKIALERGQTFFGRHSMGNLSYAGAMAAVFVTGVATIGLIAPGEKGGRGTIAQGPAPSTLTPDFGNGPLIALQQVPAPKLDSHLLPTGQSSVPPAVHQPRYVMDVRPASYEPSSSFNF